MKISKKLISLALAAMLLLGLAAPAMAADSDFEIKQITYDLSGNIFVTNYLSKYLGPGGDVVIPDVVSEIRRGAFADCTSLTGVTIPSSSTMIFSEAFINCTSLTSVTILSDFALVDSRAFEGCTSLTSVTIASEDTNIWPRAFVNCPNLTDVYFGGTKEEWDAIVSSASYLGGPIFDEDINPAIHYNSTGPETPTTPTTPTAPTFSDVPADAWYAAPVAWALEKEITNGTGANTFSPNKTCNTAEILTFLWRACGKPEIAASGSLSDVADTAWYADAAKWAKTNGMISGDKLSPETPCTRASAVMFIWQSCGKPAASKTASFTDVDKNADYAAAVAWAVEKGVTNGTGADTFSPDDICTRGHIVTFLQRAFAE